MTKKLKIIAMGEYTHRYDDRTTKALFERELLYIDDDDTDCDEPVLLLTERAEELLKNLIDN